MREVILGNGKGVALVDDEDFERVSKYSWFLQTGYVWTRVRIDRALPWQVGNLRIIALHRMVLNAADDQEVDHRDPAQTLDCRRSNLRFATSSQNKANARRRRTNRSGFKGVYLCKDRAKWAGAKWSADITHDYERIHLGRFVSAEEAARAYDAAAVKYFGEFARLNFPKEATQ